MITHEEALQYVYLIEEDITNVGKELKKYIAQQQAKEERAKKEHELLGLYQKKEQCIVCVPLMKDSPILHCVVRYSEDEKYMRILNQIKQTEEELKCKTFTKKPI